MSTAHNSANKNQIAKTVIMPGDPKRAKVIADMLDDKELVNDIRGVQGYTGKYKGKLVTVMASGMGMPSMGIYSYELYSYYDCKRIIRVGTAGGLSEKLKIKDIVLARTAYTKSSFIKESKLSENFVSASISDVLVSEVLDKAKKLDINLVDGDIETTDVFYSTKKTHNNMKEKGILAVEMETAALYATANYFNREAIALLSISDLPLKGESLSAKDREIAFAKMINLALELIVN